MENKELKERFFDRFFYAEDGSCDWDRWRNQDPNVVLEFILEELSKAREEGYSDGVKDGNTLFDDLCKVIELEIERAREEVTWSSYLN